MTKGERIKMLRERDNISQVELAERIGETKQTIYKYENDIVKEIPSEKIESIAKIFDVSPAFIMGWEENRKEISFDVFLDKIMAKDEQILLDGYRAASEERRGDMLDLAKKALKEKEAQKSTSYTEREETA